MDREEGFAPLYRDLRGQGLLTRTHFVVADITRSEFHEAAFDAILVHDVLYEPAIDLQPLLACFARWLRPGGTLYLDVWDARLYWLWRLAGRDMGFRRYDLQVVRGWLRDAGFTVVVEAPYFGSGGMTRSVRRLLWACARLSNTRHFVARRR